MEYIYLIIYIILLTIVILLHQYYKKFVPSYDENKIVNISRLNNKNRHKSKEESKYAHFSKITNRLPSIFKYPLYYLSNPIEYTVNKGDILYIPKNWWHWVVSFTENDKYCFSCNYWFDGKLNNGKPFTRALLNKETNDNILNRLEKDFLSKTYKSYFWCDNSYGKVISPKEFVNNKNEYNDCYMITLKNFDLIKQNKDIFKDLDELKKHIPLPEEIKDKELQETNFWLNKGQIDTGLHNDDYDGFLLVLSGKKIVTLFPPSDSKYLYAYS